MTVELQIAALGHSKPNVSIDETPSDSIHDQNDTNDSHTECESSSVQGMFDFTSPKF